MGQPNQVQNFPSFRQQPKPSEFDWGKHGEEMKKHGEERKQLSKPNSSQSAPPRLKDFILAELKKKRIDKYFKNRQELSEEI